MKDIDDRSFSLCISFLSQISGTHPSLRTIRHIGKRCQILELLQFSCKIPPCHRMHNTALTFILWQLSGPSRPIGCRRMVLTIPPFILWQALSSERSDNSPSPEERGWGEGNVGGNYPFSSGIPLRGIPPRCAGLCIKLSKSPDQASLSGLFATFLRRKRDSNPRNVAVQQFSRLPPSTTRPFLPDARIACGLQI